MAQVTAALALACCQYPADLFDGRISHRSLDRLTKRMVAYAYAGVTDRCLLLAGDSVYVDATAGLADPSNPHDRFHAPYQRLEKSSWNGLVPNWGRLFACLDDHELIEGWEPSAREPHPKRAALPAAATGASRLADVRRPSLHDAFVHGHAAFREHILRSKAPPPSLQFWRHGQIGGIHCFEMDTRTDREARTADSAETARMFCTAQSRALRAWLLDRQAADRAARTVSPKFVLSGSMLLPRRLEVARSRSAAAAIRSDAWDGYPATLAEVLGTIARERIDGVVFVSGDEHLACTAEIELRSPEGVIGTVLSIHCAPLHAPFPFANAAPWHFAEDDTFDLPGTDITVRVAATFAPVGDGFTLIEVLGGDDPTALLVIHSGLDEEVVHPLRLRRSTASQGRTRDPAPAPSTQAGST